MFNMITCQLVCCLMQQAPASVSVTALSRLKRAGQTDACLMDKKLNRYLKEEISDTIIIIIIIIMSLVD